MAAQPASSATHWIVSLPGTAAKAAEVLQKTVVETTGRALMDTCAAFEVPAMRTGSLDSLLLLSDEAAKADAFAEGVLRKCERQVGESYLAEMAAKVALAAAEGKELAVTAPLALMWSASVKVHDWAAQFKWDVNAWGDRDEPLPEVLRRLTAAADKVDADVRAAAQAYQEKKTALQAAERKRSGNLMVCALEDIVTPQALAAAGCEWAPADSDYLASVVVVMQKPQEEAFLAGYAQLDGASVPLGPEGRRDAVKGSPVVPGSARRVAEDKDGYVLYVLLTLKKFGDSFRAACREKRLTVRDFALDPAQAGAAARQVAQLQKELSERLALLKTESRRKYKEAVSISFHVKALRVFVESVLRFGLPVSFSAVIIKLKRNKASGAGAENALNAARLLEGVRATWKRVAGGANHRAVEAAYDLGAKARGGGGASAGAATGDPVIAGVSDPATASANANPFVLLEFELKEDTGPVSSSKTT